MHRFAASALLVLSGLCLAAPPVGAAADRATSKAEARTSAAGSPVGPDPAAAVTGQVAGGSGYWMLDLSGEVYGFGAAAHRGEPAQEFPGYYPACDVPMAYCDLTVSIEPTPSGQGYWVMDTDGFIWPYGDAPDLGHPLSDGTAPWMSMTATSSGQGYWTFSATGCMGRFGDAIFHHDLCRIPLNEPIVSSAITPSGGGYYMVAADGGIFTFGDAQFYGSTGAIELNQPVLGMAVTPTGRGYWLVAADGGIFTFGDAQFYGSAAAYPLNQPVATMVASPTGRGYLMVAEDGGIFTFGDVPFHGSLGANPPEYPVLDVAVIPAAT